MIRHLVLASSNNGYFKLPYACILSQIKPYSGRMKLKTASNTFTTRQPSYYQCRCKMENNYRDFQERKLKFPNLLIKLQLLQTIIFY